MKKLRLFLTILICKLLRFMAKLIGRGSSLPGAIALKLYPSILSQIKLPETVIAVTGSNGKTSTVEMIANVIEKAGKTVAYNREGSNQIEGVTTLIIADCTLGGKMRSEVLLLESDERYARHTFKYFHPKYYIINNLYRDQLTRNGHPEWVYDVIGQSIYDDMTLVINGDDPLVTRFGYHRDNVFYFGADHLKEDKTVNDSIYDDGKYCPVCYHPMKYDYYHYNHIGSYHCTHCDYHRPETRWTLTEADLEKGYIVIDNEYKIELSFTSIYHCYNTLAAFAACDLAGIDRSIIARELSSYSLHSGRIQKFELGKIRGTLLASKHENSISYDRSIDVAITNPDKVNVMIIVDAVSRKYFTSETSWLWDIDFEKLSSVNRIILAGRYCNDLAVRFEFTGIPADRISLFVDIPAACEYIKEKTDEYLYVITCFSDMNKFLNLTDRTEVGS
ncbi:MAG: DUF1727 domain-containing protein [Erysipelotrichaceae bacterium]|nr:DUF1727 domain-containing protein [Erysipelotrichaceae bacterium]